MSGSEPARTVDWQRYVPPTSRAGNSASDGLLGQPGVNGSSLFAGLDSSSVAPAFPLHVSPQSRLNSHHPTTQDNDIKPAIKMEGEHEGGAEEPGDAITFTLDVKPDIILENAPNVYLYKEEVESISPPGSDDDAMEFDSPADTEAEEASNESDFAMFVGVNTPAEQGVKPGALSDDLLVSVPLSGGSTEAGPSRPNHLVARPASASHSVQPITRERSILRRIPDYQPIRGDSSYFPAEEDERKPVAPRWPRPRPQNASTAVSTVTRDPLTGARILPARELPGPPPISMTTIQPLIAAEKLRREDSKPSALFKYLRTRVGPDGEILPPDFEPNPQELKEILSALRNHAHGKYLEQMIDNERYMLAIRSWLRAFAKDPVKWEVAIAPMLLMLARTNMYRETLTENRFGNLGMRAIRAAETAGLTESLPAMENAYSRFETWCREHILQQGRKRPSAKQEVKSEVKTEDGETRKRKSEQPDIKPTLPPAARASAGPGPSTQAQTKARSANALKPTASGSFFDAPPPLAAPKARPVLPSFSKKDGKSSSITTSIANPSASTVSPGTSPGGLLSSTLASLRPTAVSRPGAPPANAHPTPPSLTIPSNSTPTEPPGTYPRLPLSKGRALPNARGRSVRFPHDDTQLRRVKVFTQAAFETLDDDDIGAAHGQTAHQLEKDEGRALLNHSFKDEVDEEMAKPEPLLWSWRDPVPYIETPILPPTPEVRVQEERDRRSFAANGEPGPTPDETGVLVAQNAAPLARWWPPNGQQQAAPYAPPPTQQPYGSQAPPAAGIDSSSLSALLTTLGSLPGQVHQQSLQPTQHAQDPYGAQPSYQYAQPPSNAQWGQQSVPYGYPAQTDGWAGQPSHGAGGSGAGRGNPGRGRGRSGNLPAPGQRGFRSKTCKFWLEGTCNLGEDCTFKHSVS